MRHTAWPLRPSFSEKMRTYYECTLVERLGLVEEARARVATAAEACDGAALTVALQSLSALGAELRTDDFAWALVVLRDHLETSGKPDDVLLAALALPETPDVCKLLLDALHATESIENKNKPNRWGELNSYYVLRQAARERLPLDDKCDLLCRLRRWREIVRLSPEQAEARGKLAPWLEIANDSRAYRQHLRVRALAPTDEDRTLSKKWTERVDEGNDSKLARCFSARLAERATAEVYKRFGHQVRDIAIGQLGSDDDRWRACDLLVDGNPVDVKNARKSYKSLRYVEHCVPSFKALRKQEVRIAGVLSDYVTPRKLLKRKKDDQSPETLFLGETDLTRQRTLREWFAIPDILDLSDPRRSTRTVVPPWMFEYPPDVYAARDGAIRVLHAKSFPATDVFEQAGIKPLPYAIAVGHPAVQEQAAALDDEARAFALCLMKAVGRFGLSLPAVYLAVLRHWVQSLRLPHARRLPPARYRDIVLLQGTTRPDLPLAILDPLRTVPVLINCLDTLHRQSDTDLSCFSKFRLSGVGILQGASTGMSPDRWRTLVAYCGGWRLDGKTKVKCDHYPLVLGDHSSCPRCHRLVCRECGHCSEGCQSQSGGTDSSGVSG